LSNTLSRQSGEFCELNALIGSFCGIVAV